MKKTSRNLFFSTLIMLLLMLSSTASAIDLASAKQQGLVGETASGYLQAVKPASAEVRSLINTVNAKRKSKYSEIAKRNGTTLQAVELLAGKKAIEKSASGAYIKPAGNWVKK